MKPFFVEGMAVKVTTPTGSDFSALVGKPFCEDGNYYLPGTGGDFPSGEVGFGPELGSVNGRIVYDVKVQHIGVLHGPLSLQVREDRICDVFGLAADQFSDVCAQRGDVINYISEISMGFNPLSRVSTTPAFIPEEKTFGTLHCGHGGNASYGNRVGPHIDGIMSKPTVIVGGRTLMQDGVLLPGFVDDESFEWLSRNE
jgi:leucyl aminopeptidase (aminopeptidase T)